MGAAGAASFEESEELVVGEKQVVIDTSGGSLVIEVFPEEAPRHVQAFLRRIRENFYVGTTFHLVVPYGIIQGGDPISKDPGRRAEYGTGGLEELAREASRVSHTRGTVSTVVAPGQPDSGGSQFFICVTDQVQLDGQFTAFARVVDGLDHLEQISLIQADEHGRALQRVEITQTYERDRPPPEVAPFADTSVEELAQYRAVIRTNLGEIELSFFPDLAPMHVRQFLRFAQLGLYDGTDFHRVVPGFVIQGGSLGQRQPPVPDDLRKYVRPLEAEFSERPHQAGSLSMARGTEEDSAIDSFFIVLADAPFLDGKYTMFGKVERGLEVVDGIAQVPLRGETPIVPVHIEAITVREP